MDALIWMIAAAMVLAGAIGVSVWAVVGRQRLARRLAEAEFLRRGASDRAERAEAALVDEQTARAGLAEKVNELQQEAARMAAEMRGAAQRHHDELDHRERVFAEREASIKREKEALETRIRELNEQFAAKFEQLAGAALEKTEARLNERATKELEERRAAVERLVKPIGETLDKTQERLLKLGEQVEGSRSASESLRIETGRLARALSRPEVRGRYGEIQLRRVAELAGMTSYCDFTEQASARDADGSLVRPDMIVTLPNDRVIAVDAKCNIDAYVSAASADDEDQREALLEKFAGHVADQARKLADKRYWSSFKGAAEFVVMFVPGDQFIDAALSRKPDLLDRAAQDGVILASPSTLIGLLRAVAVGWREHTLAEEARELLALGTELHERAAVAFGHAASVGKAINQAVERYNSLVGSIDSRMMPALRKFEEAGVKSGKQLSTPSEVTARPRGVEAAPNGQADQAAGEQA